MLHLWGEHNNIDPRVNWFFFANKENISIISPADCAFLSCVTIVIRNSCQMSCWEQYYAKRSDISICISHIGF